MNAGHGAVAAELRERLSDAAERLRVPGAAVGVFHAGRQQHVCIGTTSVWNPLPVDEETLFQLGSVGKIHTATAVMVLAERGLVRLEEPVRTYLPELQLRDQDVAERVTVLNLLNHTAGWDGDFFPDTGYGDDALAAFVARLPEIDQVLPLGRMAVYNNTAVNVAGRMVEKVTGVPFPQAMRELVFEPLGLDDHLYFPWEVMLRRFAAPHVVADDTYTVGQLHEPRCLHPSGAELSCTIRGFLAFARFHLGAAADGSTPVLTAASLERMRTPTVDGGGMLGDHVGVGWMLRDVDGVRIVEHGGNSFGQYSRLLLVPEAELAIVQMANSSTGGELQAEIGAWLLERLAGVVEPEPEPVRLPVVELQPYTGVYDALGQQLTIDLVDGELTGVVRLDPEAWREFLPEGTEIPERIDMPFHVLGRDRLLVADGMYKGAAGKLVRGDDGAVEGILLGGRYLVRQPTR